MLCPDGGCKTFDNSANGYVRGEGCGALLIKRKGGGDNVLGEIVGHAIKQDGRSDGLTAPNGSSQEKHLEQWKYQK